jgi:hypothetical protein
VSAYSGSYGESGMSSYDYATTSSSLSPPSSVSASAASSSSITVSWSSVSSASYYNIYRATSGYGSYEYIGYTYSTSYTDTGLSSGTTYYYKVSTYSGSYGESGMSSYDYATTSLSYSLSAPSSVSASAASSSSITVSWSSVSSASYYNVYRATSGYGTYEYIGYTYSTSYTDTGLSSGTSYYYKVSAYSGSYGESSLSSYDYAATSSSYTDISYNTWYTYSLPLGESQDYRIYVSSGYTYTITWEDSDSGYSSCDIVVSASWQDSGSTIFNRADTELQKSFYASSSGYVIVTVQGYSSAQYGNYRIRYYY